VKLLFGDIVVVEESLIGVVVKSWGAAIVGNRPPYVEVYVRNYGAIKEYPLSEVERYQVRHKYLDDDELGYQRNGEREP